MPFSHKPSPQSASGARFGDVLAEVRRAQAAADGAPSTRSRIFPTHPVSGAMFSFEAGGRPSGGGGSHWEAALAWIEESEDAVAAPAAPEPPLGPDLGDTPDAISRDLGLTDDLSHDELNRLRRLYMWRNHPDRHDETQRARATRRVAIANMLVDRAQSRLASARKS
jgi:hypothetical protein